MSQVINILALGLYTPLLGNTDQLVGIFYMICAVRGSVIQCLADSTAMIGMSSGASSYKPKEITSYDTVGVTAADSSRSLRCDPAGSHGADPATDTLLTELAVRGLVFYTELIRVRADLRACLKKSGGSRLVLFVGDQFEFTHLYPPSDLFSLLKMK